MSTHAHQRGPKPGRQPMALVGAAYHIEPYVRTPEPVLEALFQEPILGSTRAAARPAPPYKRLRAALSEADIGQPGHSTAVIFPWLLEQAQGRDPQHRQPWGVVMDGQPRLWEPLESVLKDTPRVELLDLLQAHGYLWEAVPLFHASGSAQAIALMKLGVPALLKGQVQILMIGLTDQAQPGGLSATQRQPLAKSRDYFHRHRHRVPYDQYLAVGYPMASGVIEGACRDGVKDRLERAGRHWTLPRGPRPCSSSVVSPSTGRGRTSCRTISNKKQLGCIPKDRFIGLHWRLCPGRIDRRKSGYAQFKQMILNS